MVKQVILFRKDLNMRKGKIASQVAHASMNVFLNRKLKTLGGIEPGSYLERSEGSDEAPEDSWGLLMVPLDLSMVEWVDGLFTKIVLSVDCEEDLLRAYHLAREAGLPTALITDAGKTEFNGVPTHTTVAIGPAQSLGIDNITGPGGLVPTKLA